MAVQYVALRKQLDISEEVIAKKSDVIQQLEELLRLRTFEKYASSSESNPLQERMVFNDVEQLADEAEAEAAAEPGNENKGKPSKPRPKHKGLNPEIPRVQQRALLTDEQREGAINTSLSLAVWIMRAEVLPRQRRPCLKRRKKAHQQNVPLLEQRSMRCIE